MSTLKLTAPRWALLAAVGAGVVYRNHRVGRPLYQLYRADTGQTVREQTFDALHQAGLVEFDFTDRLTPKAVLTDAGRALLGLETKEDPQ